ncbi:MAG: hypothetical protein C4576_08215 [Desulfobacteraceae bacterium]|nr:MAG: hypothetical protein C4576_08215 [Desulfobacteraceae bacterium]
MQSDEKALAVYAVRRRRFQGFQKKGSAIMNHDGPLALERIREVTTMCDREQPIYEQISGFTVALHVFGYFTCTDLLSADDVDHVAAGEILREEFVRIRREDIPLDYHIARSQDRYLLVIGDPLFPTHFAVLTDVKSPRPYFSKLPLFGSGFDSLEELKKEFIGIDGLTTDDIAYYKLKRPEPNGKAPGKIYIFRADGTVVS